jgi:glycosyltransferase involved in cell wall biosynthesis
MKVLHIVAHLGGGVGKAHAAMAMYFQPHVAQTFALLEKPIDRYTQALALAGCNISVGLDTERLSELIRGADIVQIEHWGHPLLVEAHDLVLTEARRWGKKVVCWCHVSGLHYPLLPYNLVEGVDQFVLTSPISNEILPDCPVINSGFGFASPDMFLLPDNRVVYLGTVDFKKLHRDFFSVISMIPQSAPIDVWGHVSVEAATAAEGHRVSHCLRGYTNDPQAALARGNVFFYPLRSDHYGTAENSLIEAMSLGLVPVVLNNPAEIVIVRHGVNGLVAKSMHEALSFVEILVHSSKTRDYLSRKAIQSARKRSARASALQFAQLWRSLLDQDRRRAASA